MTRADAYNRKICQRTLYSQIINPLDCNHVLCMENVENYEADNKYDGHCNYLVEDDQRISSRTAAEEKVESIEEENECPICFDVLQSPILRPSECNHYFCYDCLEKCAEEQFACPIDRRRLTKVLIYDEIGGEVIEVENWKPDCTLCCSCLRKVLPEDLQVCIRCNQPLHLTCEDHVCSVERQRTRRRGRRRRLRIRSIRNIGVVLFRAFRRFCELYSKSVPFEYNLVNNGQIVI